MTPPISSNTLAALQRRGASDIQKSTWKNEARNKQYNVSGFQSTGFFQTYENLTDAQQAALFEGLGFDENLSLMENIALLDQSDEKVADYDNDRIVRTNAAGANGETRVTEADMAIFDGLIEHYETQVINDEVAIAEAKAAREAERAAQLEEMGNILADGEPIAAEIRELNAELDQVKADAERIAKQYETKDSSSIENHQARTELYDDYQAKQAEAAELQEQINNLRSQLSRNSTDALIAGGFLPGVPGSTENVIPPLIAAPTSSPAEETVTISKGAKGAKVGEIQEALLAANIPLPKFGADRDYGNETTEGVKEFQRQRNLPVTGIVDAATADELGISLA